MGLDKDPDTPDIVSREGVSICAADLALACKMRAIVDRDGLWKDEGLAIVPPDEQMRIELVEGYQNMRVGAKPYPWSVKDTEFGNAKMDEMHAQGRLEWQTQSTPFGSPVFIVWRQVDGKQKGRLVADLRALNKAVVPDAYPLPSQEDIIRCIQGKSHLTALDASNFFYQLPIWEPHRNRMVLVSPRGLERANVALMGFKNSPSYAQRFMDRRLRRYRHFARAYIDDVVIFSNTADEHLDHVQTILRLFKDVNLALSPEKSFIAYLSVRLLGFKVDAVGLTIT